MTQSALTSQVRLAPERFSSPRNGVEIDTFLIHHQAGTDDDAVIRDMQTRGGVTSNYTISNEGRLTLVVKEERRAWTSGSPKDGGKGAAWDRRSITVEIENETGGPEWRISDAAMRTAATLLQDLQKRYTIRNILGHRDLWERFRASYSTYCPGPSTVERVISLARGGALPAAPIQQAPGKPEQPGFLRSSTQEDGQPGKVFYTLVQRWAADWGYTGPKDGVPGPKTWEAVQRALRDFNYTGPIDGDPGRYTWAAWQRWARMGGYSGPDDGALGAYSYRALARVLNEHYATKNA